MLSKQQECEFAEGEYLVILSVAPLVVIEEALQVVVRVKESPRFTLPLEEESKSMGDSARMRSGVRPLSSRRGAPAEFYAFAVLHLSDVRSTGTSLCRKGSRRSGYRRSRWWLRPELAV